MMQSMLTLGSGGESRRTMRWGALLLVPVGVSGCVQVTAPDKQINIKRRALYTSRAQERGVAVEASADATACQAMQRVGVGQAYNLGGGWAVRGAGDPAPKPANCP